MPPSLSKTRWLTHYVLPTIILVGSGVAFYVMGSTPEVPRKPKAVAKPTIVGVAEVRPLDGPLVIETTGEVVPHRVLSIASAVEGKIVFKHSTLRVGEQVRAGETLIGIDPQRFTLAVQRLEITLNQAITGLQQILGDVRAAVDQIPSLPLLAEAPVISQRIPNSTAIPIGVIGPDFDSIASALELRTIAERVRDDLLRLPSISQVELLGVPEFQIDVELRERIR